MGGDAGEEEEESEAEDVNSLLLKPHPEMPAPIIDTREQRGLPLPGAVRAKLDEGDYACCAAHRGRVALERKDLSDLYGTLGAGHARFKRELERLKNYECRAIVIESTFQQAMDNPPSIACARCRAMNDRTSALCYKCGREMTRALQPAQVRAMLCKWQWEYGLLIVWAGVNRTTTAELVMAMLLAAHRQLTRTDAPGLPIIDGLPDLASINTLHDYDRACGAATRAMLAAGDAIPLEPYHRYLECAARMAQALRGNDAASQRVTPDGEGAS